MDFITQLKENLAIQTMVKNGWKLEEKDMYPIEWDRNREDSQYSLIYEDASYAVDSILKMLKEIDVPEDFDDEYEEEEETTDTVTSSAALFIFMDPGIGNPRYVRDVREWLARVDRAGISDDLEIEGTLHLSYDVDLENIEWIECMECGKKDLLLTKHKCNA